MDKIGDSRNFGFAGLDGQSDAFAITYKIKGENKTVRHFIDIKDFDHGEIEEILDLASKIVDDPGAYSEAMKHKKIATLFFEPSTRTRLSFEAAMLDLGGSVIGFSDSSSSSATKGESVRDTVQTVSCYCDVIVMRHPKEGAPLLASTVSEVPIINAGDGGHAHPTQTLTDLFTIKQEMGWFEGLTIGLCGDLLNGRTVHSLTRAFTRYSNNTFYLISTPELRLPAHIREFFAGTGNKIVECSTMEECIGALDILYMTRIQRERFATPGDYERQAGIYILDEKKLEKARGDLIVLHPLPKIDEITPSVDDDARAKYFSQAEYGMYARMALLIRMCAGPGGNAALTPPPLSGARCGNHMCITNSEKYLPALMKSASGHAECAYCGTPNL